MTTTTANKRITLATIKKFIRDNKQNLYALCQSSFDGMTDCVESRKEGWVKVDGAKIDFSKEQNLGIAPIWFVRESRDNFEIYDENGMKGYRIFNSCGSSVIAVKA